jgi:hypothetical protein
MVCFSWGMAFLEAAAEVFVAAVGADAVAAVNAEDAATDGIRGGGIVGAVVLLVGGEGAGDGSGLDWAIIKNPLYEHNRKMKIFFRSYVTCPFSSS